MQVEFVARLLATLQMKLLGIDFRALEALIWIWFRW